MVLANGARHVVTLEFSKIATDHPQVNDSFMLAILFGIMYYYIIVLPRYILVGMYVQEMESICWLLFKYHF